MVGQWPIKTAITQPFLLNNFFWHLSNIIYVIMLYSNYTHCYPSPQPFLIVEARLWYTWTNYHSVFHFGVSFAHHKILTLVMTNQFLQWPTKVHFDWPFCASSLFKIIHWLVLKSITMWHVFPHICNCQLLLKPKYTFY